MDPDVLNYRSLGLSLAGRVTTAAVAQARSMGLAVCVAVVGRDGHPVLSLRMDGAPLLSVGLAADKAWTVTAFGLPTHAWWELIADDPSLVHGITQRDRLVVFGGGVPVTDGGELIGAVGVSGGSSEQDRAIAEAGAAATSTGGR